MMSIDISALGASPSSDALASADAGASEDTLPGSPSLFAALLDEAADTTGESLEVSEAPSAKAVDDQDDFDELAVLVMSSLLSLSAPVPVSPEPATSEEIESPIESEAVACQVVPVDLDFSVSSTSAVADQTGSDATDAPVSTDDIGPVTAPTERASAQQAATSSKPTEDLASDRPIASDAEPLAEAASVLVPVNATEKPAGEKTLNEAMALMEKANADLPQAARSVRPLKQTRSEHVRPADTASVHANAPQAVSAAATEPSIGQPRDAVRTQATTEPYATASTAARFARALERAAAVATSESAVGAQAGTNANSGSEQQSTFGEGSRERAMQPFAAPRHAIGGVSFTVAAPTAIDVRTLARVVDAASHAAETTAATIPERDVVAQLVQSMRVQFRDGIGEAVVRLKPEHLGSVEISLKVENGAIKATVHAEVAAVRQWLESQQETLRTSLAEQGLRLERFAVEAEGKRQTGSDDAQPREQRRRQPRQRMSGKDHPVFEVTV